MGSGCPICGQVDCYREITPYWRYAIELSAEFRKERIPIARFLCRRRRKTFSLLPIQLIPYFQYTVSAVIETLLLGTGCWQGGERGFYGASLSVDPESLVTPWLIACWLVAVLRGFRRGHAVLAQFYDLSAIRTPKEAAWEEAAGYFGALGWKRAVGWKALLEGLLDRYSRRTGQFLFGTPSQYRGPLR